MELHKNFELKIFQKSILGGYDLRVDYNIFF